MTKNNNHSRLLLKHGLNVFLIVLYAVSGFCFAMSDAHAIDESGTSTGSSAFFEEGTALYWKSFSNQEGSMHTLYNNDGSVGIGTSEVTTGYKLDVKGKVGMEGLDARSNLTVGDTLTVENISVKSDITANKMKIGQLDTPEGFLLSVDGKIIAEEIHVKSQGNWPDYVFEDDYYLRSLEELEQYVRQNKHLPELPSAEEVARDGIALSSNHMKLLKKIEELTLYVIKQNKQIRFLQERNKKINELKESVSELAHTLNALEKKKS